MFFFFVIAVLIIQHNVTLSYSTTANHLIKIIIIGFICSFLKLDRNVITEYFLRFLSTLLLIAFIVANDV